MAVGLKSARRAAKLSANQAAALIARQGGVNVLKGSTNADTLTRAIAQRLSAQWKQSVIVENRGGAGYAIAAEFVSRDAADMTADTLQVRMTRFGL